jgi:hypothetical protein
MAEYTGAYIMAYLSEKDAERLSVEGGTDPADMHITLGYFEQEAGAINPETRAIIQYNLRDIGAHMFPVPGSVFARAQFNFGNSADDERPPCSVLLAQSAELSNVHTAVSMTVDGTAGLTLSTTFPIWVPHITVGYNVDLDLVSPDSLGPVTFDRLIVSWGDEKVDVTEPLDEAYHVDPLILAAA